MSTMHSPILLLGACCTAILIGLVDHRTGHMPNWMNAGSLILAVALHGPLGGPAELTLALWGILICGFAPAVLFYLSRGEGIGGGDVKTLMVLGAWLGPDLGLECQLLGFILLAAVALGRAAFQGQATALLKRTVQVSARLRRTAQEVALVRTHERFGPYLGCSTALCCVHQYLIHHFSLQLLFA